MGELVLTITFLQAVSGLGDRIGYLFTLLGRILLIFCTPLANYKIYCWGQFTIEELIILKIIFYPFYEYSVGRNILIFVSILSTLFDGWVFLLYSRSILWFFWSAEDERLNLSFLLQPFAILFVLFAIIFSISIEASHWSISRKICRFMVCVSVIESIKEFSSTPILSVVFLITHFTSISFSSVQWSFRIEGEWVDSQPTWQYTMNFYWLLASLGYSLSYINVNLHFVFYFLFLFL
jgi:hypothetical protein